ncbi:MAG: HAD hydrolase family protein [Proteobacteria bacterium]|nr:HAD hydrolase family protein [Pseudomonadota bacterium]MBU1640740.1 HAD hydrolase family protein [Pseudomonadota bacterium]
MAESCPTPTEGAYPGDCEFTQGLLKKAAARTASSRGYSWKNSLPKAKKVKLLLLDVDGVLTDGSITYSDEGIELKTFNSKDGFGLNLLRKVGVEVGIITARTSKALVRRCQDLKIDHLYQGRRNKVEAFREIVAVLGLTAEEVAYMGDDWLDLPLLAKVGFSATVADAVAEVIEVVDFTSRFNGGQGGVREVCDLIVEAKGRYEVLLAEYLERS